MSNTVKLQTFLTKEQEDHITSEGKKIGINKGSYVKMLILKDMEEKAK